METIVVSLLACIALNFVFGLYGYVISRKRMFFLSLKFAAEALEGLFSLLILFLVAQQLDRSTKAIHINSLTWAWLAIRIISVLTTFVFVLYLRGKIGKQQ